MFTRSLVDDSDEIEAELEHLRPSSDDEEAAEEAAPWENIGHLSPDEWSETMVNPRPTWMSKSTNALSGDSGTGTTTGTCTGGAATKKLVKKTASTGTTVHDDTSPPPTLRQNWFVEDAGDHTSAAGQAEFRIQQPATQQTPAGRERGPPPALTLKENRWQEAERLVSEFFPSSAARSLPMPSLVQLNMGEYCTRTATRCSGVCPLYLT